MVDFRCLDSYIWCFSRASQMRNTATIHSCFHYLQKNLHYRRLCCWIRHSGNRPGQYVRRALAV